MRKYVHLFISQLKNVILIFFPQPQNDDVSFFLVGPRVSQASVAPLRTGQSSPDMVKAYDLEMGMQKITQLMATFSNSQHRIADVVLSMRSPFKSMESRLETKRFVGLQWLE